jgi:ferric-dicitrate binding protein FerR (iron transport regulator)
MNQELLEKYFSGKASPEEVKAVLEYFEKESVDFEQAHQMFRVWQHSGSEKLEEQVTGEMHRNILGEIQPVASRSLFKRSAAIWTGFAAAVSLMFLASILLLSTQNHHEAVSLVPELVFREAPAGVKKKVELPDGTMVYLNAGSRITFPEQFEATRRKVTLEGEAYFEVTEDPSRPFTVTANDMRVTVLGTTFNFSSYPGESRSAVSLTSGKVKVSSLFNAQYQTLELEPGEEAVYDRKNSEIIQQPFNRHLITGWKDGILIFEQEDLNQIVQRLERWYGVAIQIEGLDEHEKVNWRYSGEFEKESLENVLQGISYVKQFEFTISGSQVNLNFR